MCRNKKVHSPCKVLRHCEEHSDEAIPSQFQRHGIASSAGLLAMTALGLALIFFSSCSSQFTQKNIEPVSQVPQVTVLPVTQAVEAPQPPLVPKPPAKPHRVAPLPDPFEDFPAFAKRVFFFARDSQHNFEEMVSDPAEWLREYEASQSPPNIWKMIFSGILLGWVILLVSSVSWRAFSLIRLFLKLWFREDREALFSWKLFRKSSLVPPVSLFLFDSVRGSDLLSQIRNVERLNYEEVELLLLRRAEEKDEDALLLADFRLRYRQPLYFADLESEDPFEILEVEGKRRILLVYAKTEDHRTSLSLFLKLARYPLIGFLGSNMVLHPDSIARMIYRWMREGEKHSRISGFLTEKKPNPFYAPYVWFEREAKLLSGVSGSSQQESGFWGGDSCFCLATKHIAILAMEHENLEGEGMIIWNDLNTYEIVGTRGRLRPLDFQRVIRFFSSLWGYGKNLARFLFFGFPFQSVKVIVNRLAWISAILLWPVLLASSVAVNRFLPEMAEGLIVSIFFLMLSEIMLVILGSLIWNLFSKNRVQKILPSSLSVRIRENQEALA